MLTELRISNFAIIKEQKLSFSSGLNVISGETGAGKSIILNALELVLGERANPQYVRSGCESLEVEALLDLSGLPAETMSLLPENIQSDELLISRTVSATGKGKVYINGRLGTVALLQEITENLVNICGQSQHVSLTKERYHRDYIDGFADNTKIREAYQQAYREWKTLSDKLELLTTRAEQGAQRAEELELAVQELLGVNPVAGLRTSLEEEIKALSNAERIISGAQIVSQIFNDDSGLITQLQTAGVELNNLLKADPRLDKLCKLYESAKTELEEFERDLSDYASSVSIDDAALEERRSRLAELARLERKYKADDHGLALKLKEYQSELETLGGELDIDSLKKNVDAARSAMEKNATKLTLSRKEAGKKLAKLAETELSELNMTGSRISVDLQQIPASAHGCDEVQFLISTNKGEPFKPLSKVASGGELSRVMLILKKVLRDRLGVNILVFDEVDAGISGKAARAVGQKLKELSTDSQVICITHLAQVASLADHHFVVTKTDSLEKSEDRTIAEVKALNSDEKVEEIARMLSGYKITKASRESARELIKAT